MAYADFDYYNERGGTVLNANTAAKALENASTAIDMLTYNRIFVIGFGKLTDFQRNTIKNVCCDLADFQTINADIIDSALSSYSINGVTVSFNGTPCVMCECGILIPSMLLQQLHSTGLCWGVVR